MPNRCSMRNCKNTKDVNPISKFCPACDAWMKDYTRKSDNLVRRQDDRDTIHAQNRGMSDSGQNLLTSNTIPTTTYTMPQVSSTLAGSSGSAPPPPPSSRPPPCNSASYPPLGASAAASAPPAIDINTLTSSYNQLKSNNDQPPILMDMFALMLNLHSKQSDNDDVRSEVKLNTSRLDSVEAKIGGIDDVSDRLGIALRNLPFPPHGRTELDMARLALAEVKIPGTNRSVIDVNTDVIKAVRKLPSKPGPNTPQPILGSVLVEMKNEDTRAKIMKNKYTLADHSNQLLKNIRITNMKSKEQMFMENLGNSILKKIPGCENSFVTPSGQIRESTPYQPHNPSNTGRQHHYNNSQYQTNQRPQHQSPPKQGHLTAGPPQPYQGQTPRPQFYPQPGPQTNSQPRPPMPRPQAVYPVHPTPESQPPPPPQSHPEQQAVTTLAQYFPLQSVPHTQQQPQFYFNPPTGYQAFNSLYAQPSFSFNTPPPSVSQPTAPAPSQDPYQALLMQLDPLNHDTQATTSDPNLHLLQPALPHYEQVEQENTSDNSSD